MPPSPNSASVPTCFPAVRLDTPSALGDVHEACWSFLRTSADTETAAWRTAVLATRTADGVRQRILVLRDVDRGARRLFFHTDVRSPKVAALRDCPTASLLFYDSIRRVQLQLTGRTFVHTSGQIVDRLWAASRDSSLTCYLAPQPPGTRLTSSQFRPHTAAAAPLPSRAELEAGRRHFAVIEVSIVSGDWLHLTDHVNFRMQFSYHTDTAERLELSWVTP